MLKKILATALAAAMIFGLAATAFAAPVFPDTAGIENEGVIARLKMLGIVKGDDLGNFNPNNPITRAEFTTMVVRMLGLEAAASYIATPTVFPDVTEQHSWAYGYINVASGRGLVKGYEDGTFHPSANVTQAEALTILLRAVGYSDNLPGNWPVDYVMQGATLEIIETGFVPGTAATRQVIAVLVDNTLDVPVVKEDAEHPGTFDPAVPAGTVYEKSFGVKVPYASGKVTKVDTENSKIYIDGEAKTYASGVSVYGKETLADLEGQIVKATFNKDGKIIFIAVTTPNEVSGPITAVDTVKLTVTIGGTKYDVLTSAEVYKNGALLTSTAAGALASIKDSNATLLINDDGDVYRIYASLLDKEGTIEAKETAVAGDGTVTYKLKIGGTSYSLTDDTKIVRNGSSASYSELKVNDSVKFSVVKTTELVYVDAFSNVLAGYTITNYTTTSSGATITVTKDGVQSSFVVAVKSNGDPRVALSDIVASGKPGLGGIFDLTLDRDGKVYAITPTSTTAESGELKTIASKDQVYQTNAYMYRFTFTDGTNVVLDPVLSSITDVTRNGVPVAKTASTIWTETAVDDMYWVRKDSSNNLHLELYSASISGRLVKSGSTFELWNDATTPARIAVFSTAGAPVTENGQWVDASSITTPASPGNDMCLATVKYASTGSASMPRVASVAVEKFVNASWKPVMSISGGAKEYTFKVDNTGVASSDYVKVKISDGIAMKSGSKISLGDIAVGNRMWYAAAAADGYTTYVKVANDTTAPKVSGDPTLTTPIAGSATYSGGTLTVTFGATEVCRLGYVWIAGTQYETAFAGNTASFSLAIATKPSLVTISAVDYAGNVATAQDLTVGGGTSTTVPVTGVSLNKSSATLAVGAVEPLQATITPSNATNKNVSWISTDDTVASVNASGVVMAKKVGSAIITVYTEDGYKTATCAVTVVVPVTGVTLDKTTMTLALSGATTDQLTPTVTPANATNKAVTWTSSDSNVAGVDTSGLVTAVAEGTATITVTTTDGSFTAQCVVTVGP